MQRWFQQMTRPLPHDPRAVLITGGSSGIGRAAALLFAALGDDVAVLARREERLLALQADARDKDLPGEILPLTADVTDPGAVQRAVALALAEFNRLDVLVAAAGLGQRGSFIDAPWDDIETVLRTNIDGVVHSVRAAVPAMRASGGGHIVLISSILGPVPAPFAAAYSLSKAAVDALGRALRGELRQDNIRVSVLWVGQTHTEFAEKRLGQPGRVATRVPTMPPERVAGEIVRALERNSSAKAVRRIDGLFVWAGRRFPGTMDRLLARVYG
ncbi:MAG: SDR family NAD(P)-dependent oxidoreductase [Chloroflexi bacterium]|nr:SDR family NAD(P)-dependent oxidoreductase [Chloroflexota bacterium]